MTEQQWVPRQLAGFWLRVVAMLVDVVVLLGVFAGLVLIVPPVIEALVSGVPAEVVGGVVLGMLLLIALLYDVLMTAGVGGTLGKRAAGIEVRTIEGERLEVGRALGRSLARVISAVALGLGLLWIAGDRRKQGWHDKLAASVAVKRRHLPLVLRHPDAMWWAGGPPALPAGQGSPTGATAQAEEAPTGWSTPAAAPGTWAAQPDVADDRADEPRPRPEPAAETEPAPRLEPADAEPEPAAPERDDAGAGAGTGLAAAGSLLGHDQDRDPRAPGPDEAEPGQLGAVHGDEEPAAPTEGATEPATEAGQPQRDEAEPVADAEPAAAAEAQSVGETEPASTGEETGRPAPTVDPNMVAIERAGLADDAAAWLEQVAAQVDPRLDQVSPAWRDQEQAPAARACAFGLLLGHLATRYPHMADDLEQVAEAHPSFSTLLAGSRLATLQQIADDRSRAAAWLGPLIGIKDSERVARLLQ